MRACSASALDLRKRSAHRAHVRRSRGWPRRWRAARREPVRQRGKTPGSRAVVVLDHVHARACEGAREFRQVFHGRALRLECRAGECADGAATFRAGPRCRKRAPGSRSRIPVGNATSSSPPPAAASNCRTACWRAAKPRSPSSRRQGPAPPRRRSPPGAPTRRSPRPRPARADRGSRRPASRRSVQRRARGRAPRCRAASDATR